MDFFQHEPLLRFGCFAGVLFLMTVWEHRAPRRSPEGRRLSRWACNLGLIAIDTVLVRLLLPLGAVGMALVAERQSWGVFNNVAVPSWLAVVLSVVVLDLTIYLQHVLFHAVPALWRLHLVHHSDLEFDASTGVRFHPIEMLLSMGIKLSAVVLLGAPALAVLLFEVILNVSSLFNHGNVRLPSRLDRVLRWLVVTPDMHRVHHSIHGAEQNSNFGFNLSWWDRLLGTYRAQPAEGHAGMTIGLEELRKRGRVERLERLLTLPFETRIVAEESWRESRRAF